MVLFASWLAYAAFYFPRLAFSVSKLGLLTEPSIALSRPFLGLADALFLVVYATGQFIWGGLSGRWGPRRLISLGLGTASVAALALAFVHNPWLLLILLLLQGLAQSTGWVAVCGDVAAHTPSEQRGFAFGILSTSYAFGALAAPVLLGWIAYSLIGSWRAAPMSAAVLALIVLRLYGRFLRSWQQPVLRASPPVNAQRSLPSVITTARSTAVWLLSGADFFLKPAIYATVFWTPVLVRDALPTLSPATATMLAGLLGLAGLVSPVLVGFLSDRLFHHQRVLPALLSLAGCILAFLLFPPCTQTGYWWLTALDLFLIGVTLYAAESLVVGIAAAEAGGPNSALAVGIVNGVGSFGGIFGGLIPGIITGPSVFYSLAIGCLLASAALLPLVRHEQHARRQPRPSPKHGPGTPGSN